MKVTEKQKAALLESFYYATKSLTAEALFEWVIEKDKIFRTAAEWVLLSSIYEKTISGCHRSSLNIS